MRRIFMPMGVPPGSAVSSTVRPRARRRVARRCIWVVLPEPSMPSKVMKRPRVAMGSFYCNGGEDSRRQRRGRLPIGRRLTICPTRLPEQFHRAGQVLDGGALGGGGGTVLALLTVQ